MSRARGLRGFLIGNYLVLYLVSLVINGALGLLILRKQLGDVEQIFTNRISNAIQLQKNELLNELALNDQKSLVQHLELIRRDLGVDQVTLVAEDAVWRTRASAKRPGPVLSLIERLIDVRDYPVRIANDFSDIEARLIVRFEDGFVRWLFWPFVKLALGVFLTSMMTTGALFLILFGLLDRRLIQPLEGVTSRMASGDLAADGARGNLVELTQLERASVRFRELNQVAVFARVARQVAHDVRSPLTALNVVSKSLVGLPEDARELLRAAIARIEEIAAGLIVTSRARADAPPEPFDLDHVVRGIVREKQAQGSEPEFVIEADAKDASHWVVGHAVEMKRVVSNLLQNSIEAGARSIRLTLESDRTHARLIVRDDGAGIPAEVLARLGRSEVSYGKSDRGTGLGLSHAYRTVEAVGGAIEVESAPGRGTVISIRLPGAEAHA